jgi:hypothetical protein
MEGKEFKPTPQKPWAIGYCGPTTEKVMCAKFLPGEVFDTREEAEKRAKELAKKEPNGVFVVIGPRD